jgi:hypothetical protein
MKFVKFLLVGALFSLTAGCGGGGGNPGTTGSAATSSTTGTSSTTPVVAAPNMTMVFVDASGTEIVSKSLSQTVPQYLKIALKTTEGSAASYTPVSVKFDLPTVVLVPDVSKQLTDAAGVLLLRVSPRDVTSSGVTVATAEATVEGASLTKSIGLQPEVGTVTLTGLTASSQTVQKGQSINVTVDVKVNGAIAPSNSVSVTFTTACGAVSPNLALVDGSGKASAVVQTTNVGNCSVSASAVSAVSSPVGYVVSAPPIAGIQFLNAVPEKIYQMGSVGKNTSIVRFMVIDSVGAPVSTGVVVNARLTNNDGGVNFCGSPATTTSGSDGIVAFSVCGGTLPTNVQVHAELATANNIFTDSNILTVQTGLPTQRFFDISATALNIYAGGNFTSKFNGLSTDISVFAADRQGNPVPNGTKIIFVSEGGQLNAGGDSSCLIASGRCTVPLIGQDYRPMGSSATKGDPRPGRVTVLAYTDGEEYFIDKPDAKGNYNNRYDSGELFEDLGLPYIDKDESGDFRSSYTNLVSLTNEGETSYPLPSDASGTAACPTISNVGFSVDSSCNEKWDGYTKVRRSIVIVFSGGEIGQPGNYDPSIPSKFRTELLEATRGFLSVRLSDYDGNPLPAVAALSTEIIPSTSSCKVLGLGGSIGSTTEPTVHNVSLDSCAAGDTILFKVSVSAGGAAKISQFAVTVP